MVQTNVFIEADSPPLVPAIPAYEGRYHPFASAVGVIEPMQLDGVPVMPIEPDEETEEEQQQTLTVSAGVAGGVVGLLVGGPILAILTGFGTAYATQQEGAAGDAARAVGQLAVEAKQKAVQVDRKHNLVQKGQVAATQAWEKAKEIDRQHNILDKTKAFCVWSWETAREQNRKHHLLERAVAATGRFISLVVRKLGNALTEQPQQQEPTNPPPTNPAYNTSSKKAGTVAPIPPPHQAVVN
jgi:hypothetical protein